MKKEKIEKFKQEIKDINHVILCVIDKCKKNTSRINTLEREKSQEKAPDFGLIKLVEVLEMKVRILESDFAYLRKCIYKPPTEFSFDKENNDG